MWNLTLHWNLKFQVSLTTQVASFKFPFSHVVLFCYEDKTKKGHYIKQSLISALSMYSIKEGHV